jgi:lipopolysaccharide transport system ATP-binding protein
MGNIAIKVENLGKRYRIGLKKKMHDSVGAAFLDIVKSPIKNYRKYRSLYVFNDDNGEDIIWALKNVSFELRRGEILGVIGRNGAGKSTLLKVLSRVTDPTSGRAEINGRVSSLLEVGTGFHPELTGRENVYLNAIILGMSKKEVDRKFSQIVDFSEVGKFIDTPVKRYSSGMKVRLAFAVSAHLDPEILIVDEVLAVGDMEFQKKCLGKMENVASTGKTVLFVSHNMAAIQNLCTRGILLENGELIYDLPVDQAVKRYIASAQKKSEQNAIADRKDRSGNLFRFTGLDFLDRDTMEPINIQVSGQPMLIRIRYDYKGTSVLNSVAIAAGFYLSPGVMLFSCRSDVIGKTFKIVPGEGELYCEIPNCPLAAGRYSINLLADVPGGGKALDLIREAIYVDVEQGDFYGTGKSPPYRQGVLVKYDWLDNVSPNQEMKCY